MPPESRAYDKSLHIGVYLGTWSQGVGVPNGWSETKKEEKTVQGFFIQLYRVSGDCSPSCGDPMKSLRKCISELLSLRENSAQWLLWGSSPQPLCFWVVYLQQQSQWLGVPCHGVGEAHGKELQLLGVTWCPLPDYTCMELVIAPEAKSKVWPSMLGSGVGITCWNSLHDRGLTVGCGFEINRLTSWAHPTELLF